MDRTALPFFRDTWVEVDLNAISSNVSSLARFYKSQGHNVAIMAVVKANAYGHGAIAVAKEALAAGATFLGVALLDEALELRKAGIQAPILVLGKTRPENAELARSEGISVTVFEQEWLEEATRFLAKSPNDPLRIHVKMDTGMGRLGQQTVENTMAVVCAAQKSVLLKGCLPILPLLTSSIIRITENSKNGLQHVLTNWKKQTFRFRSSTLAIVQQACAIQAICTIWYVSAFPCMGSPLQ